jgi:1-acyl-sn-glycerol-3-phosphate acyltransferase
MRTPFVLLSAIVTTLTLGSLVVLARLFRVPERAGSIYGWAMRTWARSFLWSAGVRLQVHGVEHVPAGQGAVFIANHVSWYDIFALAGWLRRYSFVAKHELRRIPVFGFAAEATGVIFLDRDNRKSAFDSYKVAAAEIRRGRSVVVCPEGTRGSTYALRAFKKGPFVLAISAQSPIVPVVVYGAREVMPKGSFRIRPGVIHLHFLEPVSTEGASYDDRTALMAGVWERMADVLERQYGVPHQVGGRGAPPPLSS